MITDEKKDFLSVANDLAHERYIDSVNENGKAEFTSEEEHARHRKSDYLCLKYLEKIFPDIVNEPIYKEVMEYYNNFEGVKAEAKARLNIN